MAAVAGALRRDADGPTVGYVTQFLHGVARAARDEVLLDAIDRLRVEQAQGLPSVAGIERLAGLVHDRMGRRISI